MMHLWRCEYFLTIYFLKFSWLLFTEVALGKLTSSASEFGQ